MTSRCVLCVLCVLALVTQVTGAEPLTPASVPDPSALLAGGKTVVIDSLQKALKRQQDAATAVAAKDRDKRAADAEVVRLQGELKVAKEKQAALAKAIAEKLPAEVQKLKAATDAWTTARTELSTAQSTSVASGVLAELKLKLDATNMTLDAAKKAFASFVRGVNGTAGTGIVENLDPLVVNDAFSTAQGKLDEKVADVAGKHSAAQGKAGTAALALTTAVNEQRSAEAALQTATAAAGPQIVLQEVQQLASRPVKLPPAVVTQIGNAERDSKKSVDELVILKDEVAKLKKALGEFQTAQGTVNGELKSAITTTDGKVTTLQGDVTAVKKVTDGLDARLKAIEDEMKKISEAIGKIPLNPVTSEQVAALLNSATSSLATGAKAEEILGLVRQLESKVKAMETKTGPRQILVWVPTRCGGYWASQWVTEPSQQEPQN
ncbi:MAG: hypothetical protein Q7S29_06245 [Candidatus Peribacter sp.]|nr:hypothetical protein [Candidatus Peribacter sp.]